MRLRRFLVYGLGSLWMLDGLLKIQPAMFHAFLVSNVLAPAATDSQPHWLASLMMRGALLWIHMGVWSNWLNFGIEFLIGLLILWGPERVWGRAGLWLSLGWGAVVWIFAEGLGGLVSGSPTFLQGSPGSIPFYALAAILLLLPAQLWSGGQLQRAARYGLGLFWLLAFIWQVLPSSGFWTGTGLAAQFGDVTMNGPEPAWLQMAINAMVVSSTSHPIMENALYSAILLSLAVLTIWRPHSRSTWLLGTLWVGFVWAVPQAFGTLFSGTGTDPGMIAPFALLVLTLIPRSAPTPAAIQGNPEHVPAP